MKGGKDPTPAAPGDSISKILRDSNNETFAAAKDAIMRKVLLATLQEAVDELGSPEHIAMKALAYIGEEQDTLLQAVDLVKEKLAGEVANQASEELSDAEALAQAARSKLEEDTLTEAGKVLQEQVIAEIAAHSTAELNDAKALAEQARAHLEVDGDFLTESAEALKDHLIHEIADRASEDLSDAQSLAELAQSHLQVSEDLVQESANTLKEKLAKDVAEQASHDLGDVESLAAEAQTHLQIDETLLQESSDALKEHLVQEVSARAKEDLADAATLAEQARPHLDLTEEHLQESADLLREKVIDEIAERSIEDLADPEVAAAEAKIRIDAKHEAIVQAVDQLKLLLVDEIAERSIQDLADPEVAAEEAQKRIDTEHASILEAIDQLKEQILQNIVSDTLSRISDEVQGSLLNNLAASANDTSAADFFAPDREAFAPDTPLVPEWTKATETAATMPQASAIDTPQQVSQATPKPSGKASTSASPKPAPPKPTTPRTQKKVANGYPVDEEALLDEFVIDVDLGADLPEHGYYVYGIVANHEPFPTRILPKEGFDPKHAPTVISYKSIAALVNKFTVADFRKEVESPKTWKEKGRHTHEQIFEKVTSAGYAVLPMPRGRIYYKEKEIKAALTDAYKILKTDLQKMTSMREWSIKIYCDMEKVQQAVAEDDQTADSILSEIEDMMGSWTKEGVEVNVEAELDAIRTGMEISHDELIETIFINCEQHAHRSLHAIAQDHVVHPPSEDSVFGSSKMVLNASYLVYQEQSEAFRGVLEELATEHERLGFFYYIGGPNAPCHFTTSETPIL